MTMKCFKKFKPYIGSHFEAPSSKLECPFIHFQSDHTPITPLSIKSVVYLPIPLPAPSTTAQE